MRRLLVCVDTVVVWASIARFLWVSFAVECTHHDALSEAFFRAGFHLSGGILSCAHRL